MEARLPTVTEITEQLDELEDKVLATMTDVQVPVLQYVAKAAEAAVGRLPEDRPDVVAQGITFVVGRVDFAKRLLDAQTTFAKAVLDAAVAPVKPRPVAKARTARTAKAA